MKHQRIKKLSNSFSYFFAILLISSLFMTRSNSFPDLWTIGAVSGTGLLLLIFENPSSLMYVQRCLSWSILRFVGRISYSLYLFHWPVIVLLRWTMGLVDWTWMIFAVVASFVLAILSYFFIETPARGAKAKYGL
jgi:peptidoglycan/LPS O-acetylase OafA/YrhL